MERLKKCPECGRYYRGEGYSGFCTKFCLETKELTGKDRERALIEIHGNTKKTTVKSLIKNANKKWLKEKEQVSAKSRYRVLEKLLRKELYKDGDVGGWSKKFDGLRG